MDRFINNVNTMVKRHNSLVANRFVVRVALRKRHADHVSRWVGFAAALRVKHVVLDLNPDMSAHHQCEAADRLRAFKAGIIWPSRLLKSKEARAALGFWSGKPLCLLGELPWP
uniref:Uncharacterized protein n=1 Tax=Aegilops tauschii TaxID=37682 RepID=R7W288_AEGTA